MIQIDDSLVQQSFQELATYIDFPSVSVKHQAQNQTVAFKKIIRRIEF